LIQRTSAIGIAFISNKALIKEPCNRNDYANNRYKFFKLIQGNHTMKSLEAISTNKRNNINELIELCAIDGYHLSREYYEMLVKVAVNSDDAYFEQYCHMLRPRVLVAASIEEDKVTAHLLHCEKNDERLFDIGNLQQSDIDYLLNDTSGNTLRSLVCELNLLFMDVKKEIAYACGDLQKEVWHVLEGADVDDVIYALCSFKRRMQEAISCGQHYLGLALHTAIF